MTSERKRGPSTPVLTELEAAARDIGGMLGAAMPPGVGFCLMLFTFGPDGWSTYLSNAQRADMIAGIRELLSKLEA